MYYRVDTSVLRTTYGEADASALYLTAEPGKYAVELMPVCEPGVRQMPVSLSLALPKFSALPDKDFRESAATNSGADKFADYVEKLGFATAIDLNVADLFAQLRAGIGNKTAAVLAIHDIADRFEPLGLALSLPERISAVENASEADAPKELFAQSAELLFAVGMLYAEVTSVAVAGAFTPPALALGAWWIVADVVYEFTMKEKMLETFRDTFEKVEQGIGIVADTIIEVTKGDDNSTEGGAGEDVLVGGGGSDTAIGFDGNDYLYGNAGDDVLYGGNGVDSLSGSDGNDVLVGGAGADRLDGRLGDDQFKGGPSGDIYNIGLNQGSDIVDDGGDGTIDTILFYGAGTITSASEFSFSRSGTDMIVTVRDNGSGSPLAQFTIKHMDTSAGRVESLQILGANEDQNHPLGTIDLGQKWTQLTEPDAPSPPPPATIPTPDDPFDWRGNSNDHVFNGTDADEVAGGGDESDTILGNGGDDFLLGQGGVDVLNGGDDNDILVDDDAHGPYSVDNLAGGPGDDQIVFFGAGNTTSFDSGDGGTGNDLAVVDVHTRSDEWKFLNIDGSMVAGPRDPDSPEGDIHLINFETIAILYGTGDDRGYGGSEVDYLKGGDGEDFLDGGSGNDDLFGGDDDDSLVSVSGVDWIDGGSGYDKATIDLSSRSIDLTFIETEAMSDDGFTFANGTFVKNVERFELTTGSGDDELWFGNGDISLLTGDNIATGGGNDALNTLGHGRETVDGGSGVDQLVVDYSWADAEVRTQWHSDDSEFSIYEDKFSIDATNVENFVIFGGTGSDRLTGRDGDDVFSGNGGDDDLDGAGGSNTLYGGAGDDAIESHGLDWIDGGDGVDGLSYAHSGLANITFDQAAASSAAGFTFVDGTFVKNVERAFISLYDGTNVVWFTGHGENSAAISDGTNTVNVDFGWSTESISTTYVSFEWRAYSGEDPDQNCVRVQRAGFSGWTMRVNVIGGSNDDDLVGFTLDDVLQGGSGNDTLDGAAGHDTAIYEDGASGVTVHLDSASAQHVGGGLGSDTLISIENLIGSNFGDRLSGNGVGNVLTGGLGNDRLDGNGGGDTLLGGIGADRLSGGGGRDTFAFNSVSDSTGAAFDTIVGLDTARDRFDFVEKIKGIDADVTTGKLSNASFDKNLENAVGSAQLAKHHALLFTADAGSHSGDTFLIADGNGKAGYQAGEDYVFFLQNPADLSNLAAHDFI